jgi:hypothetical protein
MPKGPPSLIAINHDEYHAEHVGRTPDGRQFFLTTPFEPAIPGKPGKPGCEFVALFLFDKDGRFLEAKIESFGPRALQDDCRRREVYETWLRELGPVTFERIEVQPFEVERFGTRFGLIPRPPEEKEGRWWVELLPGNYMAFHEPWDSGDYDT